MNKKYTPPGSPEELVLAWLNRCRESQFAHYEVAVDYQGKNGSLGIPVIAINALVSASLFATFLKSDNEILRYIALALSLISIILSSLHTYLKFSDKAETHRISASEYSEIRRKLEILHATKVIAQPALDEIGKEISELAKRAPNISVKRFAEVQKGIEN
jgi:hypothetical protein